MKRKIIIGSAVATICVAAVLIFMIWGSEEAKINRSLDSAYRYMTDGSYDEAIIAYSKVLALDEFNEEALKGIAEASVEIGEYDSAIDYLEKLLTVSEEADIYELYAEILIIQERYRAAYDVLNGLDDSFKSRAILRLMDRIKEDYLPDEPVPSLAEGRYDHDIEISFSETEGVKILYTLDGTEPMSDAIVYTGPIVLKESTLMMVKAVTQEGIASDAELYSYTIEKPVEINIDQVNNSHFPEVMLYANIVDEFGDIVDDFKAEFVQIEETDGSGNKILYDIEELYKITERDAVKVNLVMDISDSMTEESRLSNAKAAASDFVREIDYSDGDKVGIMSFNEQVYVNIGMSDTLNDILRVIEGLQPEGRTALYDALYAGILKTYDEDGVKCVIAYTDGVENESYHSKTDVIDLSKSTGIPVYIVGIGDAIDMQDLQSIAAGCDGGYYSMQNMDLDEMLSSIYNDIYRYHQGLYAIKFTSELDVSDAQSHQIRLVTASESPYTGEAEKTYVPESGVSVSEMDNFVIDMEDDGSLSACQVDMTVSSTLKETVSGQAKTYYPTNMFDGDLGTVWAEGDSGSGVGEWIHFVSDRPFNMKSISIINGYGRDQEIYKKNNRLLQLVLSTDNGDYMRIYFNDGVLTYQTKAVGFDNVSEVHLEVVDVAYGTRYNDLCISGLMINGQPLPLSDVTMNIIDRTGM